MLKSYVLINCLIAALATSLAWAQYHPFETLDGLKRFDKSKVLTLTNLNQASATSLSIKDVKIGDNVLQQAINLAEKGGQLGRIRGGARSDKIKFSFNQAYDNTRLEQELELYFDKHNGFIQQVNATYRLEDAYASIEPVRRQTLSAVIKKYGSPMTMQQAYALTGKKEGDIKMSLFIKALQKTKQLGSSGIAYFKKRNISRSTKWVKGEQDYALLHSGFDRCYLWQTHSFNQILTFCFFDKSGANPNNRGIELELHNFPISQKIKELGMHHSKLNLSL